MKRPGVLARAWLAAFALATLPAWAGPLPDPVRFGARLELGDIDSAREWLAAGLDPNFVGDRIGTGLMIGAWTGNIPLMELFVARGADINRANGLGETALLHAAWRGQVEAVQWLLARGARVNAGSAADPQWSALHYAAFAGHGEAVRLLLERGADINGRSPNGSTPLMMAIYEGHDGIARALIDRGADRTLRNENGDGALEWALKFRRGEIAGLLASPAVIAAAAAVPRPEPRRSVQEPESIEEVLRIRRILQSRGISLDVVDQRIAAARARIARAARGEHPQAASRPMPVLEIGARRAAPAEQTFELRYR